MPSLSGCKQKKTYSNLFETLDGSINDANCGTLKLHFYAQFMYESRQVVVWACFMYTLINLFSKMGLTKWYIHLYIYIIHMNYDCTMETLARLPQKVKSDFHKWGKIRDISHGYQIISKYPMSCLFQAIIFCATVDVRNPAPVEVGSWSHSLRGSIHSRCCRFLFHQQYQCCIFQF